MIKNKILQLILTFVCLAHFFSNNCFAQNSDVDIHNKYWYYKARLHNDFMSVGTNAGQSIPFGQRLYNDKTYPNAYFKTNDLKAGDAAVQLGIYVGVLATEYRLLKDKFEPTDKVKHELFCALNAINRIDYYAEPTISECPHPGNGNLPQPTNLNGFFMRDDIPGDFVKKYYSELNYYNNSIDNANGALINHPTETFNNLPVPINMHTDKGFTQFSTEGQYYTKSSLTSFTTPPFSNLWNDNAGVKGHLNGTEESQDQLYYLILGTTLAANLVDGNETDNGAKFLYGSGEVSLKQEAMNIVNRLIKHVSNDPLWAIRDPANSNYKVQIGHAAGPYAFALDNTGCFVKNSNDDFPSYAVITNPHNRNSCTDYRNFTSYFPTLWDGIAGTTGGWTVDMQGFYHVLAATCNCSMENRNYLHLGIQAVFNFVTAQISNLTNWLTEQVNKIFDKINNLPNWLHSLINGFLNFIQILVAAVNTIVQGLQAIIQSIGSMFGIIKVNTTQEHLIYNNELATVLYSDCANSQYSIHFGSKEYFGIFAHKVLHPNPDPMPTWAQLSTGNITSITYPTVRDELREILRVAPCEGNYNFGPSNRPNLEWGAPNRLDRMDPIYRYNINCQTNALGEYHGLDFMLLHNLYFLSEAIENDNTPITINDQDYRYVNNTFPLSDGTFNKIHTKTKGAFEELISASTLNPYAGVDFRAGKVIDLKPGFTTKAGADFRAYIDPYHCAASLNIYEGAINKVANTQTNDSYNMTESEPKIKSTKNYTESNLPQALNNEQLNQIQNLTQQIDSLVKASESMLNTLDSKIIVYPNPNNGVFNIAFNLAKEDNVNLQILDANGKEVYAHKYVVGEIEYPFNFTSYPKGIYMAIASSSKGQIFTQKITIN